MTRIVYRLLSETDWQRAEQAGTFDGSEHDRRDGFIHFSTAEQVAETAAKHYTGRSGLVLLAIDAAVLGAALRWEPSRGGALFPHLYGPLPVAAVMRVDRLAVSTDGRHVFPVDLV